MKLKVYLCFVMFFVVASFHAQIIIEPLESNDIIKNAYLKKNTNTQAKDETPLELPFLEDFSYEGPFPSSEYWTDSSAYVNWDFPINPPSIGVATLDGFDKFGQPYSTVFEQHGPADTLTSRKINLNYPAQDSIYLSFFYQPKGLGNYPEFEDSLRLEFYQANQQTWTYAWSVVGEDFPQNFKNFKQVLIPIRDTALLTGEFRFRFMNYASLHAGYDHWHIDYIRIDRGRNRVDTIFDDIAFVDRPLSLLKDYQSMPYRHYVVNPISNMGDVFTARLTTLRSLATSFQYQYSIFNEQHLLRDDILFEPQPNIVYRNVLPITKEVKYSYDVYPVPYTTFYTDYRINSGDSNPKNDSIRIFQVFSNYYAYDDGSAEERLSLVSNGGGFVAVKFDIKKADTLRAVQFYFNQANDGPVDKPFFIFVWNSANNQPGSIAYQSEELQPFYPEGVNRFSTYILNNPPVLNQGTYYIGWVQTSNFRLNVGFDRNINTSSKIFFNTSNSWNQLVSAQGSLMIRPLFGDASDTYANIDNSLRNENFVLFPNPAQNQFSIRASQTGEYANNLIEVFDLAGSLKLSKNYQFGDVIDCNDWSKGVYLIKLSNGKQMIKNFKLIVTH